ncbi:MAG TPA: APC family permease [Candidatus Sulfotelmatobacter sp.]|nr:APC family permease [Candidatus Sulfotelmatobacter sp.]
METPTAASPSAPSLRRTLTLSDLILYGVIVIQPVAPMSVFGVLSDRGRGHVVTAVLIAMVAMLFTGISYGRMARAYPSAGSAFTYVAQEVNPAIGFVTGWSMVMDYMLNPLICTVWCAGQANQFAPGVPTWIWKVFFAIVFTLLNIRGVKTSARINAVMALLMGMVVVAIFIAAARYVFGAPQGTVSYLTPFYDRSTFTWGNLFGCTSIAVLTYIGFDGISTLSEEAENPRRNILLATVLTCLVIGVLSAVEVYVAQLIWPAREPFPDINTAYSYVAGRAWKPLFPVVGFTLLLANFGSGFGSQLGAARLLFGMGRSNALPKKFFGAVDAKTHVPRNSVIFVGVVALLGAFVLEIVAGYKPDSSIPVLSSQYISHLMSVFSRQNLSQVLNGGAAYGLGAEMLNFGALIAFMGVNVAALLRYFIRSDEKKLGYLVPPVLGFLICLGLWLNLSKPAMIVGSIWMAAGILFGAIRTKGFRGNLINFELPPEEN